MRWTLKKSPNPATVVHLQEVLQVDAIVAKLLAQRGIETYEQAKAFFRPSLDSLHDPYLMKDMDKAVARIAKAIENNENIMVFGDYDVDGTTAVALMYSYLVSIDANATTYIPDRYEEGYGVSYQGIDYAHDNDISLIVTLDCGVKAIEKVAYAKEKGIDFIICDHHRPGNDLPKAVAVLDPKRSDCEYPYKELCGCGVGFKLAQALEAYYGRTSEANLIQYLDLVATAIGADIVPITGENRILAYYGLEVINSQPRIGFKAIIDQLKKSRLTITDVVFTIAPRINAAGRMKHGQYAVNLLTETNLESAQSIFKEIDEFNTNRRETDKQITAEALQQIEENNEQKGFTTVVFDENWHKGVIGIVASRLTETYYRPTIVFTESGGKYVASARSVKGFDVYNVIDACSEFIEQFGGHKYAAGITILPENYEVFKLKFESVVAQTIPKKLLTPEVTIDSEITFDEITPKLHRILSQFAPFGPQNMTPVFMSKSLHDTGYGKRVGEDKTHLRLTAKQGNSNSFVGIGFGMANKFELIKNKQKFNATYTIDENQWQGSVSLQLKLRDIIKTTKSDSSLES